MSRLVSMDAMNKISHIFLTYHSFLFYISKLLDITVILYFLYSFSFSPRRRFVFQTEISDIIYRICFNLIHGCFISFPLFAVGISLPFFVKYLLILTDPGLQRSGTLLHWFVVVVLPILEDLSIYFAVFPFPFSKHSNICFPISFCILTFPLGGFIRNMNIFLSDILLIFILYSFSK